MNSIAQQARPKLNTQSEYRRPQLSRNLAGFGANWVPGPTVGEGWAQSNVRYYLYAYLYVVFAVDAVYLFPWATVVELYSWPTVLTMAVFLGILAVGLVHVWRAGVLRWR